MLQLALMIAMSAADGGAGASASRLISFEFPQTVAVVNADSEVVSLGVPVRIRAVKTRLTAADVVGSFIQQVDKHGLYVPPRAHLSQVIANETLTAYDPLANVAYTLILQPNPDKTTTVIVSTSDLKRRMPADGTPLPVATYPGGEGLVRSHHEGGQSFAFTIPLASVAEVESFYARTLKTDGWQRSAPNLYFRGDRELRLSLRTMRDHLAVTVNEGPRSLTLEPEPER